MGSNIDLLPNEDGIIVIGAGVIGLSTAVLLVEKFPKKRITIIAEEFPGDANPSPDYASMWAGAHYRPIPATTPQLRSELDLSRRTFEAMKEIASKNPSSGVGMCPGLEFLDNPPAVYNSLVDGEPYAGPGDGFRVLKKDELIPGSNWGCEYQTFCVNVTVYCSWLLSRFISKGGRVVKQRLRLPAAAFEVAKQEKLGKIRTIVNCSGRNFGLDNRVAYIRGQTCLVRQQYHRTITKQNSDGTWFALIPRPLNGGTIVGVSKEPGDPETAPRSETRERILRQSVEFFPDFVGRYEDFDVVADNVGRRPWREGGLRIEVEHLADGTGRVVHGYGAGGRGYELSWGIGERLVRLISGEASELDMIPPRL